MDYEDPEDHEQNVYGSDARQELVDNDEMDPEEGAFMEGYDADYEEEAEEEEDVYEEAFDEDALERENEPDEEDFEEY